MVRRTRAVVARRLFDFAEILGDRSLISATVGPDLDPILLSLGQAPDYQFESPGWALFPKKWADRPNRFRIHRRDADGRWRTLDLPETEENYHAVQPLGEDGWLLVRSRADGEGDRNAHVYNASGRLARSFHAGDGIEDVQATRDGQIWVSYFDEGVFGGTRLGQAGLVRLDDAGRCTFEFDRLSVEGLPGIADCYALNVVSQQEVWLCYYTDFPLVRLVDGEVAGIWSRCPVEGSPGFAIDGDVALFAGGYGGRDSLHLLRPGDRKTVTITPTNEDGRPLTGFTAFGRRDRLFLRTGDALHSVAVSDAVAVGRIW